MYSTYVILEISSDAGSVKFKTDPDRAVNFFVNKSVFIPASPLIRTVVRSRKVIPTFCENKFIPVPIPKNKADEL